LTFCRAWSKVRARANSMIARRRSPMIPHQYIERAAEESKERYNEERTKSFATESPKREKRSRRDWTKDMRQGRAIRIAASMCTD
jgi:hypothetical protein